MEYRCAKAACDPTYSAAHLRFVSDSRRMSSLEFQYIPDLETNGEFKRDSSTRRAAFQHTLHRTLEPRTPIYNHTPTRILNRHVSSDAEGCHLDSAAPPKALHPRRVRSHARIRVPLHPVPHEPVRSSYEQDCERKPIGALFLRSFSPKVSFRDARRNARSRFGTLFLQDDLSQVVCFLSRLVSHVRR